MAGILHTKVDKMDKAEEYIDKNGLYLEEQ